MIISRRHFLKNVFLGAGLTMLPLGRSAWALAGDVPATRRLVVIILRGAVDGLSVVAPFAERNYYMARPNIAIPEPGRSDGLINLDNHFGLNPALGDIVPLWQNQTLAFIHASGSPATTRSHFEAQDILETAFVNSATATRGWLSGLSQEILDNHASTRLLSFGNTLPKIFQGTPNVATIPTHINAKMAGFAANPQMAGKFSQLYSNNPELSGLYGQGVSAQAAMTSDLHDEMEKASKGAQEAKDFALQAGRAADLIRNDPNVEIVFMDIGGWDTHVNQGSSDGMLAKKLNNLGTGLATLAQGLGAAYQNTAILVMSEFGRTVAQNGNGGTDHGHGNVAWLMGGNVRGGKVYGRWPGVAPNQLYEGRDLQVTTDFRSIIGAVASKQFNLTDAAITEFMPEYRADSNLQGILA